MVGKIRVRVQGFSQSEQDESVATLRGVRVDQQSYGYKLKEGEELGPVLITGIDHNNLQRYPIPGDVLELEVAVLCIKYQKKEFRFGQQKLVPRWGTNLIYHGGIKFVDDAQNHGQQRITQQSGANTNTPPPIKDGNKSKD